MATSTYDLINGTTLASAASSVTFSSIPQSYRDLILVVEAERSATGTDWGYIQFNGDTTTNYKCQMVYHDGVFGQGAGTQDSPSGAKISYLRNTWSNMAIAQIMDYSATNKHKSYLARSGDGEDSAWQFTGRWPSTSAITSVRIVCDGAADFKAGGTFYLYGIAS